MRLVRATGKTQTFYRQNSCLISLLIELQLLGPIKRTDCTNSLVTTTLDAPTMKLAGFLLLLSGWAIVLVALMLLPAVYTQVVFVLAGLGVEVLGLTLVVRSHLRPRVE